MTVVSWTMSALGPMGVKLTAWASTSGRMVECDVSVTVCPARSNPLSQGDKGLHIAPGADGRNEYAFRYPGVILVFQ